MGDQLGHQLVEVVLDVGVILVGGDDAVAAQAHAVLVVAVLVEEDAARHLRGAGSGGVTRRLHQRLELEPGIDELVHQVQRVVEALHDLDDLRHRVHVGVGADGLQAQRLRCFLGLDVQHVEVVVEARQRAGRVRRQVVLGVLGRRLRDHELVGDLLVVRYREALLGAVGHQRLDLAVVEPVVLVVGQGDVLGGPVEGRHLGGQGLDRRESRLQVGHGGQEPPLHLRQFFGGGYRRHAAGHDGSGVRGAPADERAPLVREPLEAQRARDHVAVRLHQREHRWCAQQVRCGQKVDMEHV